MTAAFLISIGSRGDTEPVVALCAHLLRHFDAIHLVHLPEYTSLIPSSPRIISHPLPFSASSFTPFFSRGLLRHALLSLVTFTPFDTVRMQVECLCAINRSLVLPFFPRLLDLVRETRPGVILATTLALNLASSVGELMNVPCCLVNFQPNTPTRDFPHYMVGTDTAALAGVEVANMHRHSETTDHKGYLATYDAVLGMYALQPLNDFRIEHGLKPLTRADLGDLVSGRTGPVINSYPTSLIPRSEDYQSGVHVVPPLAADYLPSEWDANAACPETAAFLSAHENPVVVTFGSMGHKLWNTRHTRVLFTALRAANVRNVLMLNYGCDLGAHQLWRFWDADLINWASSSNVNILCTKEKPPYAWLFPKTRAVICHGGAGTTFAALRAGVPLVVLPVLGDQFFWGPLLERLCLGCMPGPLKNVGSVELGKAVDRVLGEEVQGQVKQFSVKMRAEGEGGAIAAGVLKTLANKTE